MYIVYNRITGKELPERFSKYWDAFWYARSEGAAFAVKEA